MVASAVAWAELELALMAVALVGVELAPLPVARVEVKPALIPVVIHAVVAERLLVPGLAEAPAAAG